MSRVSRVYSMTSADMEEPGSICLVFRRAEGGARRISIPSAEGQGNRHSYRDPFPFFFGVENELT